MRVFDSPTCLLPHESCTNHYDGDMIHSIKEVKVTDEIVLVFFTTTTKTKQWALADSTMSQRARVIVQLSRDKVRYNYRRVRAFTRVPLKTSGLKTLFLSRFGARDTSYICPKIFFKWQRHELRIPKRELWPQWMSDLLCPGMRRE